MTDLYRVIRALNEDSPGDEKTLAGEPTVVVNVGCAACGEVHLVRFRGKSEFAELQCTHSHKSLFSSFGAIVFLWEEIHKEARKIRAQTKIKNRCGSSALSH